MSNKETYVSRLVYLKEHLSACGRKIPRGDFSEFNKLVDSIHTAYFELDKLNDLDFQKKSLVEGWELYIGHLERKFLKFVLEFIPEDN